MAHILVGQPGYVKRDCQAQICGRPLTLLGNCPTVLLDSLYVSGDNGNMPNKQDVTAHFTSIARRYDLVNHMLSFNIDRSWRKKLIKLSGVKPGDRVIDICAGTCDILLDFYGVCRECDYVGVDMTQAMLDVAEQKIRRLQAQEDVRLICADAQKLPVPDDSFDVATMGFGLRNLEDPAQGLREMGRVLKPGARALILEFAPAQKTFFGRLYTWYLQTMVPFIGGVVTGSKGAYEHLSCSIQGFFQPPRLLATMQDCGFSDTRAHALFGKIAYIYVGTKK
jgi:demethylmenaquinone methyltransferase/2-methoxy-6-polyprenyl-1,4-benzoquinol methylase